MFIGQFIGYSTEQDKKNKENICQEICISTTNYLGSFRKTKEFMEILTLNFLQTLYKEIFGENLTYVQAENIRQKIHEKFATSSLIEPYETARFIYKIFLQLFGKTENAMHRFYNQNLEKIKEIQNNFNEMVDKLAARNKLEEKSTTKQRKL